MVGSAPATLDTLNEIATALNNDANMYATLASAIAAKAGLASPAFTGTPTAPTAAGGTNNTQIASTAFVQGALGSRAPLDSPVFSGTPQAPTAGGGTNNAQIATTQFVQSAIANRIASVVVTPTRPSTNHVVADISPSISGTTLTLNLTWKVDAFASPTPTSPDPGGGP